MTGRLLVALVILTVSLLSCFYYITGSPTSLLYEQSLANIMSGYEAPLKNCEDPEWVIPDSYIIFLVSGTSFQQHKQAISKILPDFEEAVESNLDFSDHTVAYSGKFDQAQLSIIRADESVELVECNRRKKISNFKGEDSEALTKDTVANGIEDERSQQQGHRNHLQLT